MQPIAYTHTVHLAKGLPCTFCHVGVDQGPEARIPGVTVCMSCHSSIATDRPEIKKIAAYKARGEEIPWVRVYNYSASAHVRFNHAPHIRAGVDCAACHGDMTKQTTAERKSEFEHGLLSQLPHAEKGLGRLRDLSLLSRLTNPMERRDFIKISALSGVMATLEACRRPEKQLIRFVPEEELIPGIATWKPSVCTLCSAGCGLLVRVMQGEAEVVRHGQQGLIKMGLAKKLEGNPQHPVNRGKLCARGQAGLAGALPSRPHHPPHQAHRRARLRRVPGNKLGRCAEGTVRAPVRACKRRSPPTLWPFSRGPCADSATN